MYIVHCACGDLAMSSSRQSNSGPVGNLLCPSGDVPCRARISSSYMDYGYGSIQAPPQSGQETEQSFSSSEEVSMVHRECWDVARLRASTSLVPLPDGLPDLGCGKMPVFFQGKQYSR